MIVDAAAAGRDFLRPVEIVDAAARAPNRPGGETISERRLLILSASLIIRARGERSFGACSICSRLRSALRQRLVVGDTRPPARRRPRKTSRPVRRGVTPVSSMVSCSQPAATSGASLPDVATVSSNATSAEMIDVGLLVRALAPRPGVAARGEIRGAGDQHEVAHRAILKLARMLQLPHHVAAETVDRALAGERAPAAPRGSGPARTAPRCRRRYRAACRAPACGRTSAPDWSRRNDSASRPGSAGRRYWRPRASPWRGRH